MPDAAGAARAWKHRGYMKQNEWSRAVQNWNSAAFYIKLSAPFISILSFSLLTESPSLSWFWCVELGTQSPEPTERRFRGGFEYLPSGTFTLSLPHSKFWYELFHWPDLYMLTWVYIYIIYIYIQIYIAYIHSLIYTHTYICPSLLFVRSYVLTFSPIYSLYMYANTILIMG